MAYPNLVAEMARIGITEKDLSAVTGRTTDTIRNWIKGKTEIPIGKALVIRDRYFPTSSIEYLYASEPVTPTAREA